MRHVHTVSHVMCSEWEMYRQKRGNCSIYWRVDNLIGFPKKHEGHGRISQRISEWFLSVSMRRLIPSSWTSNFFSKTLLSLKMIHTKVPYCYGTSLLQDRAVKQAAFMFFSDPLLLVYFFYWAYPNPNE